MAGYDTFGAKTETSDPNGNVTTTGYDAGGRPVSVTAPSYTPPGGSPMIPVARKTYDPLGQVATATDPLGHQTRYSYDQPANLATDGAGNTAAYSYDYAGRKTKTTLPDGTATTATFDAAGRQTGSAKLDTNGAVLASRSTTLDADGNPLTAMDARGHTSTFTYDATNRMSSYVQPVTATASITTSFGYDPAGNRTRFTDGRGNAFVTTYNTWNLPEKTIEPSTAAYPNLADRTFVTTYNAAAQV